jgi:hypothetical protein
MNGPGSGRHVRNLLDQTATHYVSPLLKNPIYKGIERSKFLSTEMLFYMYTHILAIVSGIVLQDINSEGEACPLYTISNER